MQTKAHQQHRRDNENTIRWQQQKTRARANEPNAKQWEIVQEWTAISFAASYVCVCVLVCGVGRKRAVFSRVYYLP